MNQSFFILSIFFYLTSFSQSKKVTITIDDMPFNGISKTVSVKEIDRINSKLLKKINIEKTPVTAFMNGNQCLSNDNTQERIKILQKWINDTLVTLGNHTLKHLNHSQNNLDSFKEDLMMNDFLIRSFSKNKPLTYFRFPFNATGKDSLCQKERYDYLKSKNYISTPFTIESSDYIFNTLYCHELDLGNKKRADSIAECYLQLTINLFNQMEKNSIELFGRNVNQIYLCHANKLNADYYSQLIQRIKNLNYSFVSLEETLKDEIYKSK
jgi:hypothetical protein